MVNVLDVIAHNVQIVILSHKVSNILSEDAVLTERQHRESLKLVYRVSNQFLSNNNKISTFTNQSSFPFKSTFSCNTFGCLATLESTLVYSFLFRIKGLSFKKILQIPIILFFFFQCWESNSGTHTC